MSQGKSDYIIDLCWPARHDIVSSANVYVASLVQPASLPLFNPALLFLHSHHASPSSPPLLSPFTLFPSLSSSSYPSPLRPLPPIPLCPTPLLPHPPLLLHPPPPSLFSSPLFLRNYAWHRTPVKWPSSTSSTTFTTSSAQRQVCMSCPAMPR